MVQIGKKENESPKRDYRSKFDLPLSLVFNEFYVIFCNDVINKGKSFFLIFMLEKFIIAFFRSRY